MSILGTLDRNLKAAYSDAISRGAEIDASEIVAWRVREMRDGKCVAWWNLITGEREAEGGELVPDWNVAKGMLDERK